MIFTNFNADYESYKERNLYYKIFAGYFFNEILPDYKKNKEAFFNLLINLIGTEQHFNKPLDTDELLANALTKLSDENLHVSFDFHPKQVIKNYPDRGEASDIIIWGNKYFISIEAKYLSDWSYKKDIEEVQSRIEDLGKHVNKTGIQILLIKEEKWKNNNAKLNQPGSNLMLLKNNQDKLKVPVIVITWSQILELIEEPLVKKYLLNQLERKLT